MGLYIPLEKKMHSTANKIPSPSATKNIIPRLSIVFSDIETKMKIELSDNNDMLCNKDKNKDRFNNPFLRIKKTTTV